MRISFQEAHHLILKTEDGKQNGFVVRADYVFESVDVRKNFQEDIRGKDLLETFDFQELWSQGNSRKSSIKAQFQDLKVWKDRLLPHHHSISFFATIIEDKHEEEKYVEFPISRFQSKIRKEAGNVQVVYLDFLRRKDSASSTTSTTGKRKFSIRRKSAPGKYPSEGELPITVLSTYQKVDNYIESPSLSWRRASDSLDTSRRYLNDDVQEKSDFLAIKFKTRGGEICYSSLLI